MTVNEAYKHGMTILKNTDNEAPATDAGVLLCFSAGFNRTFLYTHSNDILDDASLTKYLSLLERRASGEPLQYLTGLQEFMSLPFRVGPGVLVPRQDTELLVETVINLYKDRTGMIRILDVGTGSGCIAVSLAHHIAGCRVVAIDKMSDALAIAEKNALENGVAGRIKFIKSDLFEAIAGRQFDIIVSNPPYIRTGDIASLQKEVRCHEPLTALDGGMDGLEFYRRIMENVSVFLLKKGALVFETGYDQAAEVAGLMADKFEQVRIYKDLAGVERVVSGICR
jgi:release factor glutamine methyltransferase